MKQGQRDPSHPPSLLTKAPPDGPGEQSPAGLGATARPDPKAGRQESSAGYAEMGSRQRVRWNEAGGDVDPDEPVWGTHKESDPLADAPAREGRDRSETAPAARTAAPTSTPKIARE